MAYPHELFNLGGSHGGDGSPQTQVWYWEESQYVMGDAERVGRTYAENNGTHSRRQLS